jgi:hypothetical protein
LREFDGKTVTVVGTVSVATNELLVKSFILKDDTGDISVVTERAVPREGSHLQATGRVSHAFSIAGHDLLVLVEKKK